MNIIDAINVNNTETQKKCSKSMIWVARVTPSFRKQHEFTPLLSYNFDKILKNCKKIGMSSIFGNLLLSISKRIWYVKMDRNSLKQISRDSIVFAKARLTREGRRIQFFFTFMMN
ncbi:hypothetical protein RF11_10057 [Thelohanellus kitauei]|uniref:Uncharacterized protein n=1 Tax=Thelohanellus kitauei TaxID=669202 RepID=A0A0C2IJQ9_THEKT|nr:hypothetical protein RF11_10057 [Thelohanellus kitauei]